MWLALIPACLGSLFRPLHEFCKVMNRCSYFGRIQKKHISQEQQTRKEGKAFEIRIQHSFTLFLVLTKNSALI